MSDDTDQTTYTIDELIQRHDDEYEAARQLEAATQSTINRCTYSDGYIRQNVYWCESCYPNDSVYVCYGCIMNCHVACNDIHEMYEKSYVRCDCGTNINNSNNNDKQILCQFDNEQLNKSTLINIDNIYTHNNQARYCYCDTIHSDKHVYMTCQLCEDWYHSDVNDKCLRFMNNRSVPDNIDDTDLTLICRLCLNKPTNDILLPYIAAEIIRNRDSENKENTTDDFNIQSPAPKKHRSSALDPITSPSVNQLQSTATSSPNTNIPCTRIYDIPSDVDMEQIKRYDLLTSVISRDLCECNDCMILYEQNKLDQKLFGDADDDIVDNDNDTTNNINSVTATPSTASTIIHNQCDDILQQMISRLPVPAAANMIEKYNMFKQALSIEFTNYVQQHQPNVVTGEIIQYIVGAAKERLAEMTLIQESNSDLMSYAE